MTEWKIWVACLKCTVPYYMKFSRHFKGPLKYLLRPLLRKNQFAVTQRTYACIEPNLDNIY